PLNVITPPMFAVSGMAVQNGASSFENNAYTYEKAMNHRSGKGFIGFKGISAGSITREEKQVQLNLVNMTYYTLYPLSVTRYHLPTSSPLSTVYYTLDFVSPAPKRYWVKLTRSDETDHLNSSYLQTDNTWDNFGNITGTQTLL